MTGTRPIVLGHVPSDWDTSHVLHRLRISPNTTIRSFSVDWDTPHVLHRLRMCPNTTIRSFSVVTGTRPMCYIGRMCPNTTIRSFSVDSRAHEYWLLVVPPNRGKLGLACVEFTTPTSNIINTAIHNLLNRMRSPYQCHVIRMTGSAIGRFHRIRQPTPSLV